MSSRGAASRDVASVDQTLMRPSSQPVANSPPAATVSATAPTHCGCKCSAKHVPSVRHPQSLARLSLVPLTSRSRSKARLRTPPLRPCRGSLETAPASRRDSASDVARAPRAPQVARRRRPSEQAALLARSLDLVERIELGLQKHLEQHVGRQFEKAFGVGSRRLAGAAQQFHENFGVMCVKTWLGRSSLRARAAVRSGRPDGKGREASLHLWWRSGS